MRKVIMLLLVLSLVLGAATAQAQVQTTITLSAAGDVVLGGDPTPKGALGQSSENFFAELIARNGMGYPFRNVAQYFLQDDVSFVNLECAMTTSSSARKKTHVLRAKPEYAGILTSAGIEVCNIANNHTLDFGVKGANNARATLDKAGVRWCDFTANGTYTVRKNGMRVKIGFAGFQTPTSQAKMQKTIQALARRCDVVVASFHWCDTKEWTSRNYPSDRRMAQAAINAGADLVLGHHRHVPAGIEQYKGKYIVYDMGNFVVGIKHLRENGTGRGLTDSMIFQWTFSIDAKGKIADKGIRVVPCTTSTSRERYPVDDAMGNAGAPVNNFCPGVLTGSEAAAVLDRIQALSTVTIPR